MFKSIAILALAGSTIAHPALQARKLKTVVHTVVVTHTQVVTYTGSPKATSKVPDYTPAPQPVKPTPSSKKPEVIVVTQTPKPSAVAPQPKPSVAPAPAPAGTYMDIVNEYRKKLGLSALKHSSKMEANAQNTVDSSNGKMVHKLNPGSMGQVLAPGKAGLDGFKKVFLGGWLCEVPTAKGIESECPKASEGWAYNTIDHYKILVSPSYNCIGCALAQGIWSCDLGKE